MKDTRTGPKDVLTAFLLDGVAGVEELAAQRGRLTKRTLRDVMKKLNAAGKDYKPLERWCKDTYGFGLHNKQTARGPRIGDERPYKSQGQDGAPYMKLPLSTLTDKAGVLVKAQFLKGRIVVVVS